MSKKPNQPSATAIEAAISKAEARLAEIQSELDAMGAKPQEKRIATLSVEIESTAKQLAELYQKKMNLDLGR